MGYLEKNAHAVACLSFGVLACSVLKGLNDLKSAVNYLVVSLAVHIYHCADSAVFVLEAGVVKSLLCIWFLYSVVVHIHYSLLSALYIMMNNV